MHRRLAFFLVVLSSTTPVIAQTPRPAQNIPAPVPGAAPVVVERITVHGTSLEGNLEGNSPDRGVIVYLPPSYAKNPSRRYPVYQFTYAAPGSQQVRNEWRGQSMLFNQLLAQEGAIVWVVDNRSASGKGAVSRWPGLRRRQGSPRSPKLRIRSWIRRVRGSASR